MRGEKAARSFADRPEGLFRLSGYDMMLQPVDAADLHTCCGATPAETESNGICEQQRSIVVLSIMTHGEAYSAFKAHEVCAGGR